MKRPWQTGAVVAVETEGIGVVHVSHTPGSFAGAHNGLGPAPCPGAHGRAILSSAGFSESEIERLISSQVVFLRSHAAAR
jgi:crotonobetainyl-CoA:carnitine CoA-transferase CaiB-like acyl-CoA transferase